MEATKKENLKVPQLIRDIEKRLSEDCQRRSETEQRSRIEQRGFATNATTHSQGADTADLDEEIEDQWTPDGDGFHATNMVTEKDVREWDPWVEKLKECEAERQAEVKRRHESYEVCQMNALGEHNS